MVPFTSNDIVLRMAFAFFYFYGFTTSQFVPLSSSDIYKNHTFLAPSFGSQLGCNIASWFSTYHQKNMFMITYFEAIPGQAPLLKSDLLSFSTNHSHSVHRHIATFNISDTLHTDSTIQNDAHLMDVALSSSHIMILSQVGDSSRGSEHLFYRIISNYQSNTDDIRISAMKIWSIPYSSADQSAHYTKVTAAKLYGSDVFIIVYVNYNQLRNFVVNANTAEPLSLDPNILASWQNCMYIGCPSDESILLTAIKVRASKTNERFLIVWSARYYSNDVESVRASLYTNDGAVVNSITIIEQQLREGLYLYRLYDSISFNISTQIGLYGILYYDTSATSNNRICVRILDDSASHLLADFIMIDVKEQAADTIQSATLRVLDLATPPPYKLYLVVSWTYDSDNNPGAVYIQMLEFSWTSSMDQYHLSTVDVPYEVFSIDQTWKRVCVGSVDNLLLVASFGDSEETYTQLLTTTITTNPTVAPTNYPTITPTKHPTNTPTDYPSKAPVTVNPTKYPTVTPTKNPTDTTKAPTSDEPTAYTKRPSLSPIVSEKIVMQQKENDKQYLFVLIAMPFIIFCGYRVKQYYMSFVVVDKALILIIGICRFDGDGFNELPGVEDNVNALRRLWFDTYHYTVKICNENTLKCNKRDIIRFIDKYKHLLEDTNYKAVIVHILSHGSGDDSFVTSDLKTMRTSFFEHELITITEFAGHPQLIKLIFHHACRGHADYFEAQEVDSYSNKYPVELKEIVSNKEYGDSKAVPLRTAADMSLLSGINRKPRKEADPHSNCAVLYGTIEDRALSDDGHFTESICKVFGRNSRNLIKRDLYCLIRNIGSDLESRTKSAQICSSKGIGTLRNKIRFQKCTNKIRYRETN
eukprot:938887_1